MKFKLKTNLKLAALGMLIASQLACGTTYQPIRKNRAYLTMQNGQFAVEINGNAPAEKLDFRCTEDGTAVFNDRSYLKGRTGGVQGQTASQKERCGRQ